MVEDMGRVGGVFGGGGEKKNLPVSKKMYICRVDWEWKKMFSGWKTGGWTFGVYMGKKSIIQ